MAYLHDGAFHHTASFKGEIRNFSRENKANFWKSEQRSPSLSCGCCSTTIQRGSKQISGCLLHQPLSKLNFICKACIKSADLWFGKPLYYYKDGGSVINSVILKNIETDNKVVNKSAGCNGFVVVAGVAEFKVECTSKCQQYTARHLQIWSVLEHCWQITH